MALTRNNLKRMGLESDQIDAIIEDHVETVDSLKSQIQDLKNQVEDVEDLKSRLASTEEELNSLKSDGGDWQKKYEQINSEFELFKKDQEAKDLKATKENAFKKLLLESGVSEKKVDRIIKYTDLSQAEIEDGSFKDAESLIEGIRSEWGDSFVTTSTEGTNTQIPPANNSTRFTTEEIARMTPEEINANWSAIKDSMKGE